MTHEETMEMHEAAHAARACAMAEDLAKVADMAEAMLRDAGMLHTEAGGRLMKAIDDLSDHCH